MIRDPNTRAELKKIEAAERESTTKNNRDMFGRIFENNHIFGWFIFERCIFNMIKNVYEPRTKEKR